MPQVSTSELPDGGSVEITGRPALVARPVGRGPSRYNSGNIETQVGMNQSAAYTGMTVAAAVLPAASTQLTTSSIEADWIVSLPLR